MFYQGPDTNPGDPVPIPGTELWLFIVFPLPFMSVIYHILCYKFQRKNGNEGYRRNDLITSFLATTLLLPLNGVVTNFIKLTVGRPRPDFAYRLVVMKKFFEM